MLESEFRMFGSALTVQGILGLFGGFVQPLATARELGSDPKEEQDQLGNSGSPSMSEPGAAEGLRPCTLGSPHRSQSAYSADMIAGSAAAL